MSNSRAHLLGGLLAAALLSTLLGCARGHYGDPGEPNCRVGDEIMVCGKLFHTGAPVVLWTDPGGYDAYRAHCHFNPDQLKPSNPVSDDPVRYGSWRRHVPAEVMQRVKKEGWSLDELREHVDLFVLHYDACGTSRRCFQVLQDMRGLSVHFMLDLDGTIYQTLDLKERAWHAGSANDRSIGIEIANIGAYPNMDTLNKWYAKDVDGHTYVTFPNWMDETGIRTADFVARPVRNEVVVGPVQRKQLYQYDFTEAQYESLIKLTATLCEIFPRITPDYPRDVEGDLVTVELSDEEFAAFSGLVGHFHITSVKVDPGPAFQWDRVVKGTKREMARPTWLWPKCGR